MNIVTIRSERDAADVLAKLEAIGEPWHPAGDLPCIVYLDAGRPDEISRIPGVAACWTGRAGPFARVLHASAHEVQGRAPVRAGTTAAAPTGVRRLCGPVAGRRPGA